MKSVTHVEQAKQSDVQQNRQQSKNALTQSSMYA